MTSLLLALFISCSVWSQDLSVVVGDKSRTFSLADLKTKLKSHAISNVDPVYKQKKTFVGFALSEILEYVGPISANYDDISFTAKDGYSPSLPLKQLFMQKSFVAYREQNRRSGFSQANQNGKKIDLSPFYLVWEKDDSVPEYFPRPYQLVKIEIQPYLEKFKEIFPKDLHGNILVTKGFEQFRSRCFRCHSVNGIGGSVGPELNSPNNVLEYWNSEKLKEFVFNPVRFRANSMMPTLTELKPDDVDFIFKYLKAMQDFKKVK